MLPVAQGPGRVKVAMRRSMPALRQHARLSIGVAGAVGGSMLLAVNISSIVAGAASFALVPLAANAALLFGGVMFLRERSKAADRSPEPPTR